MTTGASNDIEKATDIARSMITRYGMSEKFGLMGLAKVQDMYLSGRAVLECGDATATEVDREIMKMLAASYEEYKRILPEHMDALHKIAAYLIEKETITGKEFMEIFREVEGKTADGSETDRPADGGSADEDVAPAAEVPSDNGTDESAKPEESPVLSVPVKEEGSAPAGPASDDKTQEAGTTWEEAMAEANITIPGRDTEDKNNTDQDRS